MDLQLLSSVVAVRHKGGHTCFGAMCLLNLSKPETRSCQPRESYKCKMALMWITSMLCSYLSQIKIAFATRMIQCVLPDPIVKCHPGCSGP